MLLFLSLVILLCQGIGLMLKYIVVLTLQCYNYLVPPPPTHPSRLSSYDANKCVICLLRWSAEFGTSRNGSPELHVMLAEYIYSESPETVTCHNSLTDNVDVSTPSNPNHCSFFAMYLGKPKQIVIWNGGSTS